jgi:hypothetical protein
MPPVTEEIDLFNVDYIVDDPPGQHRFSSAGDGMDPQQPWRRTLNPARILLLSPSPLAGTFIPAFPGMLQIVSEASLFGPKPPHHLFLFIFPRENCAAVPEGCADCMHCCRYFAGCGHGVLGGRASQRL